MVKKILIGLISLIVTSQLLVVIFHFSALTAVSKKDFKTAVRNSMIAAKLAIFPSQKGAMYGELGQNYIRIRDAKNAIASYEKEYKLTKKWKNPKTKVLRKDWLIYASLLYINSDYDLAIEIANKLGCEAYAVLADTYIEKQNYDKALEYANTILETDKTAQNYTNRAYIYKQMGKDALALKDLAKAISLCADYACIAAQRESFSEEGREKKKQEYRQKFGF